MLEEDDVLEFTKEEKRSFEKRVMRKMVDIVWKIPVLGDIECKEELRLLLAALKAGEDEEEAVRADLRIKIPDSEKRPFWMMDTVQALCACVGMRLIYGDKLPPPSDDDLPVETAYVGERMAALARVLMMLDGMRFFEGPNERELGLSGRFADAALKAHNNEIEGE